MRTHVESIDYYLTSAAASRSSIHASQKSESIGIGSGSTGHAENGLDLLPWHSFGDEIGMGLVDSVRCRGEERIEERDRSDQEGQQYSFPEMHDETLGLISYVPGGPTTSQGVGDVAYTAIPIRSRAHRADS